MMNYTFDYVPSYNDMQCYVFGKGIDTKCIFEHYHNTTANALIFEGVLLIVVFILFSWIWHFCIIKHKKWSFLAQYSADTLNAFFIKVSYYIMFSFCVYVIAIIYFYL
ncbi:MAG TPA: hypothetical protein VJ201_02625 [Candidatus Babeliales bacterium]|nr:hypothetical protein [Candidatus Babeliales bacterium]